MGIESLFNYTALVMGRVTDADDPITNDEENHPEEDTPALLATTPCAVQERSQREQLALKDDGAVASTHRVYMTAPLDPYGDVVALSERHSLVITELGLELAIRGVRDGGGRGHHLEIDALEIVG